MWGGWKPVVSALVIGPATIWCATAAGDEPLTSIGGVPVPTVVAPLPTPSLPLPPIPVPSLPVPSLPAPAPPVAVPVLPAAPAATPAPATAIAAPVTHGAAGASTPTTTTRAGTPAARPGSGAARPAGTTATAGPEGTAAQATSPAHRRAVARRDRRLRRTVRRLAPCLGVLTRPERRVLVLRAGLGDRPARSRQEVARRIDTSVSRVARLERRGLRRLRTSAREGTCGAGAPTSTPPPPTTAAAATAFVSSRNLLTASPQSKDQVHVLGEHASGAGSSPDDPVPPATGGVPAIKAIGHGLRGIGDGALDPTIPIALAALLGFAFVAVREIRRARGS